MRSLIKLLLSVLMLSMINSASAQVTELATVSAVRQTLIDVMKELSITIEQATSQVKGAGNSLQANAQNVIADLDEVLGSNIDLTFDKLSKTQLDLVENAKILISQTRRAVDSARKGAFQDATTLIQEADITAFNTSYTLPCRNQEPRLVYWTPDTIDVGGKLPTVKIRGNFLNFGSAPKATINGQSVEILARTDTEMLLGLPEKYVTDVQDITTGVIKLDGLSARNRKQGVLHFLLGCSESVKIVDQPYSMSITIRPKLTYSIEGKLWADYKNEEIFNALSQDFYRNTGGKCSARIDVSQQYCIDTAYSVVNYDLQITTKNGNGSYAGPAVMSGPHCVHVPALIAGNGEDCVNLLVGKICNCKGNGWVGYKISINAKRLAQASLQPLVFKDVIPFENHSIQYEHPEKAKQMIRPIWKYDLQVTSQRGSQVLSQDVISDIKRSSDLGVVSQVQDGRLSVTFP